MTVCFTMMQLTEIKSATGAVKIFPIFKRIVNTFVIRQTDF